MALCKFCDKHIDWRKTEAGKSMPVDPEPLEWNDLEIGDVAINVHGRTRKKNEHMSENGEWWISHFATCPHANEARSK